MVELKDTSQTSYACGTCPLAPLWILLIANFRMISFTLNLLSLLEGLRVNFKFLKYYQIYL